jgi:class 3 adenylate cyclase/CHASE2 domain-containing sensor protein
MTRIERRVFVQSAVIGLLLVIVVIGLDRARLLSRTEDWLYDLRARNFQYFTPPRSDKLVHIDIDDRALEAIGAWPWPRAVLAEILDEIRLAGIQALAMDVLFTEPQAPTFELEDAPDGKRVLKREIDNDARFAEAIGALGCVIVPASLSFIDEERSPLQRDAFEKLQADPELDEAGLLNALSVEPNSSQAAEIRARYLPLRRQAVQARVAAELDAAPVSIEELKSRLIRRGERDLASPLSRLIAEQYARHQSIVALRRFSGVSPTKLSRPLLAARSALVPLPPLAQAAAASGFVDYKVSEDGVLRSVPLLVEVDGRVYPQMGLALAMMLIGVETSKLRIADDRIVLPGSDGAETVIPVRAMWSSSLRRDVPMVIDIPWFGSSNWQTMYDWPAHREARQHLSINAAWEPVNTRQKIERNNQAAEDAAKLVLFVLESPRLEQLDASPPAYDDDDAWSKLISETLTLATEREQALRGKPSESLQEDERMFLDAVQALRNVSEQNPRLREQLQSQRRALRDALQGRAALLGWVATGRQDVLPTSIHPACPGVVAHGVIFTSILSGDLWRAAPSWIAPLVTLLLGAATALSAGLLSPGRALLVAALLGIGYVVINGLVLFDARNLIVPAAAPLLVIALVWAGCSLARVIIESAERARVTRRFRAYVDPTLVNYVIERPDEVRLEGETRELTVVFTDLAGFTTLSERLGEKTVPLLNEFMGLMVPVIRAHRGYVNKFLGDGIMFFFGAPIENTSHAVDAVTTSLRMQKALEPFNERLRERGLPTVSMRVGVSTGDMVVGDAGSVDASDYTVLGDAVNLGARLESANKATGTSILLSGRTVELLEDRFLVRPVGKLQVAGKTEGVMTFEALATVEEATPAQRELVRLSESVVQPFLVGDFASCIAGIDAMERALGPSKLTKLYREQCRLHQSGSGGSFDGTIVLTEK